MRPKVQLEAEDQAARDAYERTVAERAAREAATGRRIRGGKPRLPVPDPDRRINTNDPDSRVMPTKGGWLQGYHAQIVTTLDQIIVAAEVTNLGNDQRLLHPMLAAATLTLTTAGHVEPIGTVLADAGYCTDANLAAADPHGPELLMPPYNLRKRRDPDHACESSATAPRNITGRNSAWHNDWPPNMARPCTGCAVRASKQRSVRSNRPADAAPSRRGHTAVSPEWTFICATHNLLKLWRTTRTGPARQPAAQPEAAA